MSLFESSSDLLSSSSKSSFSSTVIAPLKSFLSHYTINTSMALLLFWILSGFYPELTELDETAIKNQQLIRYAIKGTLIYLLSWIVLIVIHEEYGNDYMMILKAKHREGFRQMFYLTIRVAVFYVIALQMPTTHEANRLLAILLTYIWFSQAYVRKAIHFNFHSIYKKKMQFVCNFSMNHYTSLVFIVAPLATVLVPELPWLPGFVTLFPILCRFAQCYVVGTHEQFLNSIKFTLNLIGFGYSVVEMPTHSHYWRIAAAVYSFYWDIFRDWKWKIRFFELKDYRIDLPPWVFVAGFLYDLFGRTIWIIFPMHVHNRGIVEMTRRIVWSILRIEREQVFYHPKPTQNDVKDLQLFKKEKAQ